MNIFADRRKLAVAIVAAVVVVAIAVAAVFTMSGGSSSKGHSTTRTSVAAGPTSTTIPYAINYHTNATLPNTPPPAPGSVKPTTQTLSSACAAAVAPVRALEAKYNSGADLNKADNATLNQVLQTAPKVCLGPEYQSWQQKELLPWMRMPPSGAATK